MTPKKHPLHPVLRLLFIAASAFLFSAFSLRADAPAGAGLEAGFREPPKQAKPYVYWHWINGNVTKDGIRKDLEDMRRIGIAGVLHVDVSVKTPPGPVRFGSPSWNDHLLYAMETAGELGLDFVLSNCPGWALVGGPWVTVEDSMKRLVWTETQVSGPVKFSEKLEQATLKGVHKDADFYRDVAVLAVPREAGDNGPPPQWSANMKAEKIAALSDGNPATQTDFPSYVSSTPKKKTPPLVLTATFPKPVEKSSLELRFANDMPGKQRVIAEGTIEVSDDGKKFRAIDKIEFTGVFKRGRPVATFSFPTTKAAYFRITFDRFLPASLSEAAWHGKVMLENVTSKAAAAGVPSVFPEKMPSMAPTTPLANVVQLTPSLAPDGTLTWDVPEGAWTIYRFGYAATGAINHPAQPEGEGWEVDKMDAAAVARHFDASLGPILKMLTPSARKALVGVEMDSWEAGPQNWSADFPREFLRRRGYDVIPYLPVIAGEPLVSLADSEAFLSDFRKTVRELIEENFFGEMRRLANANGMQLYAEPYNGLFNQSACASQVDVIMGEYWMEGHWHQLPVLASLVRTTGRTLLAAEAFTAGTGSGLWANTPRQFKRIGDRAFAVGMNRSIMHSYVHQPQSDWAPGFTLRYHGSFFGRLNTWWAQAKPWMDYLSRCQFMMQQGRAVADVLMLRHGDMDPAVDDKYPEVPAGFLSDLIAPQHLLQTRAENGKIVLPHGAEYRLLLLPELWVADVPLLRQLEKLAGAGVPVIGGPPVMGIGRDDLYKNADEWRALVAKIWDAKRPLVIRKALPADVLARKEIAPDLRIAGGGFEPADIMWAHRTTGDAEFYYVTNITGKTAALDMTFRVAGKQPEIWNAVTMRREPAPFFENTEKGVSLNLALGPMESRFVVFRDARQAKAASALRKDGAPAYLGRDYEVEDGAITFANAGKYQARLADGSKKTIAAAAPETVSLSGPWQVEFRPRYTTAFTREYAKLRSWTESRDAEEKYFSGTAVYKMKFTAPAAAALAAKRVMLELGTVREIATVTVNGEVAGTAWTHPWRVDISKQMRPGENFLEIAVSNTWVNRFAGDEQLAGDIDFVVGGGQRADGMLRRFPEWLGDPAAKDKRERRTFTTWRHYNAKTPILESGLLGPVQVTYFEKTGF